MSREPERLSQLMLSFVWQASRGAWEARGGRGDEEGWRWGLRGTAGARGAVEGGVE